MIVGAFASDDRPVIPLVFLAADGERVEIEATIDTGFAGAVLLSATLGTRLGLRPVDTELVLLADGSFARLTVSEGVAFWHDRRRRVAVHIADGGPLIGIELLRGSIGTFEFVPGGSVILEPAD